MADFKKFLCGSADLERGMNGLLTDILGEVDKTELCLDTKSCQ